MFILSVKTSRRKLITYIVVLFTLLSIFILIFSSSLNKSQAVCPIGKYNLNAQDNEDRIEFLSQFGWEVSSEPIEISTISIPSEFNSTYEKYNNIQREQGLDLSKYHEKSCTRYTYQILNYTDPSQSVRANLLVLNGKVIGGDISSFSLNGFMHGFFDPNKTKV